MRADIRIGTTGWSIPAALRERFAGHGTHLQRYARRMRAAEISSSFHRPHRRTLYERWAAAVPVGFRFAVKLPREITHDRRIVGATRALDGFLDQVAGLGTKLGPLLIRLPPSFAFDARVLGRFLATLRRRHDGDLAWEPRHPTWFAPEPERLLASYRVARIAADPARVAAAAEPGGWDGLAYVRLHGSPIMYRSPYDEAFLDRLARAIASWRRPTWCFFDNTMLNAALPNALALSERLGAGS